MPSPQDPSTYRTLLLELASGVSITTVLGWAYGIIRSMFLVENHSKQLVAHEEMLEKVQQATTAFERLSERTTTTLEFLTSEIADIKADIRDLTTRMNDFDRRR